MNSHAIISKLLREEPARLYFTPSTCRSRLRGTLILVLRGVLTELTPEND